MHRIRYAIRPSSSALCCGELGGVHGGDGCERHRDTLTAKIDTHSKLLLPPVITVNILFAATFSTAIGFRLQLLGEIAVDPGLDRLVTFFVVTKRDLQLSQLSHRHWPRILQVWVSFRLLHHATSNGGRLTPGDVDLGKDVAKHVVCKIGDLAHCVFHRV